MFSAKQRCPFRQQIIDVRELHSRNIDLYFCMLLYVMNVFGIFFVS